MLEHWTIYHIFRSNVVQADEVRQNVHHNVRKHTIFPLRRHLRALNGFHCRRQNHLPNHWSSLQNLPTKFNGIMAIKTE